MKKAELVETVAAGGYKKLLQFRFGEKGIQAVDMLKQELGISSRGEVIRLGINFLDWAIRCIENGYEITVTKDDKDDKDGKERLSIPLPIIELRFPKRDVATGAKQPAKNSKGEGGSCPINTAVN